MRFSRSSSSSSARFISFLAAAVLGLAEAVLVGLEALACLVGLEELACLLGLEEAASFFFLAACSFSQAREPVPLGALLGLEPTPV
jgi:hypothetical protein